MPQRPAQSKPVYSHTPGAGRPAAPERTELSQSFGGLVRTPARVLPAATASAAAPTVTRISAPASASGADFPTVSLAAPGGMTVNDSRSDQQSGAAPAFTLAFTLTGIARSDGAGGLTDAVPGTDYLAPGGAVTALNGETGPVSLTSTNGSVTITPGGGSIDLSVVVSGGTPGGSTGSVQYRDASGNFAGSSLLTWNNGTGVLTATASASNRPAVNVTSISTSGPHLALEGGGLQSGAGVSLWYANGLNDFAYFPNNSGDFGLMYGRASAAFRILYYNSGSPVQKLGLDGSGNLTLAGSVQPGSAYRTHTGAAGYTGTGGGGDTIVDGIVTAAGSGGASGSAGGDLTGTYPNPTLAASGVTPGAYGSGSLIPVLTIDAKGRVTSATTAAISGGGGGGGSVDIRSSGSLLGAASTLDFTGGALVTLGGGVATISTAAASGMPGVAPLITPNDSAFTWVNQGTAPYAASTSTANNCVTLYQPPQAGNIDSLACRVLSLPSPPYTVIAAYLAQYSAPTSGSSVGLVLRESSSGRLRTIQTTGTNLAYGTANWNSPTSYNGSGAGSSNPYMYGGPYIWIKIVDDGTNRTMYSSNNGVWWIPMLTESRTAFITPDQAGITCNAHQNTYPAILHLVSWQITSP